MHQNKLSSLPETFADLTALTTLDLSHNSLTLLPHNIWTLSALTNLNLSHNSLASLPFGAPFASGSRSERGDTWSTGGFFGPVITRSTSPLPRLQCLDVSFNKLTASAIDHCNVPSGLTKLDLSSNPLATEDEKSAALVCALGSLKSLKELRFSHAVISDDAFPASLTNRDASPIFSALRILDLEETQATPSVIQAALSGLKQTLSFEFATDEPPENTLRISVGKRVLKEPWEIEVERCAKHKSARSYGSQLSVSSLRGPQPVQDPVKEAWEIEAEQGLLTEGGRRRARAAAVQETPSSTVPPPEQKKNSLMGSMPSSVPNAGKSQSLTVNLSNTQYYNAPTQTLTLPPSAPPTRSHMRSFSLAVPTLGPPSSQDKIHIALPTPTLPISVISAQPFAQTLKTLVLSGRKLDLSVALPPVTSESSAPFLPTLEELALDGCGLRDNITVTHQGESGSSTPPKLTEALIPLIGRLFPSLRTLDLTYNLLTSATLRKDVLVDLIMASAQDTPVPRPGLRHLRLRGNRITDLDGFQELAEIFKGHRAVSDWKLEELDLRDNEIAKLPAELGLLPLDVFLVDGNV